MVFRSHTRNRHARYLLPFPSSYLMPKFVSTLQLLHMFDIAAYTHGLMITWQTDFCRLYKFYRYGTSLRARFELRFNSHSSYLFVIRNGWKVNIFSQIFIRGILSESKQPFDNRKWQIIFSAFKASFVFVLASLKYQSFNLVENSFPFHKFLRPTSLFRESLHSSGV